MKILNPSKFNYKNIKKKIEKLRIKDLENKKLLTNNVATVASNIAKDKKIRKLVHSFQLKCAYNPPKKYKGSCLDGRDICSVIVPDADIKLFITANIKIRAMRRFRELKAKNKKNIPLKKNK
jgi:cytidylate kinase